MLFVSSSVTLSVELQKIWK